MIEYGWWYTSKYSKEPLLRVAVVVDHFTDRNIVRQKRSKGYMVVLLLSIGVLVVLQKSKESVVRVVVALHFKVRNRWCWVDKWRYFRAHNQPHGLATTHKNTQKK